jgi:hypothetical protein
MNDITPSQRTAAKVAAITFPIAFFCVAFAHYGLRGDLVVTGDPAETMRRIAAAVPVFRLSVGFDVAYATGMTILLTSLYVVLSPVSRYLALLEGVWKLVYAITAVMISLGTLSILRLSSEPAYMQGFGNNQVHALIEMTSAGAWDQYYVGLVFWALSSTTFAWLWLKSRYVPRALAIAGIATSAWCVFCAVAYLVNPGFANVVHVSLFDVPMVLFYLALSIWILTKGLRVSSADAARSVQPR